MTAVLGIDAAWVAKNSSGVALIRRDEAGKWEYVAAAPSCKSFIELLEGHTVNWSKVPAGGRIGPNDLLKVIAKRRPDMDVKVIPVDIPVGKQPVIGKRPCDVAMSKAFRSKWAGPYYPRKDWPGAVSHNLMADLKSEGYPLATCCECEDGRGVQGKRTIEVYPHPAIVRLLDLEVRLEYKVDKSRKYWPDLSLAERRNRLSANFRKLHGGLSKEINGLPDSLIPDDAFLSGKRSLKCFEDTLDSLVCAWVGACYLDGDAECYGDADAAIWVPNRLPRVCER